MAALEGSISEFGVADILQLIYFQKKTGVLIVTGRFDQVRIHFYRGNIVSATSSRRPEDKKLGHILLKKNLITEEVLQSVLEEQKRTKETIGDLLIQKGYIDRDALQEALKNQIIDQVVQIFSWNEGTYLFKPLQISKEPDITIDTQHVLMEGLRRVDEWSVIEGLISPDSVFKRKEQEVTYEFTPLEERILQEVDGQTDVSTIIDLVGETELETLKAFVSLMEKGVIEPVEETEEVEVVQKKVPSRRYPPLHYLFGLVVVILLAITAVNGIRGIGKISKQMDASTALERLRLRIESYRLTYGRVPEDVDIKLTDPWGRPYVYRPLADGYLIFSKGPDGVEGTGDDIY